MQRVFAFLERMTPCFLRFSLALVLIWIGALKFVDPTRVRMVLQASLPFLAFDTFVYVLGALEIVGGILLVAGVWLRYAGLLCLALFAGTLLIFVITPSVTGFPTLTVSGEFLLKDIVLAAAAVSIAATDAARQVTHQSGLLATVPVAHGEWDALLSDIQTEEKKPPLQKQRAQVGRTPDSTKRT
jgi:uncharacterized membrane protein YkgB